jgi:hypothetical protein
MALFTKNKEGGDTAVDEAPSEAAQLCMRVGQILVEGEHFLPENLAAVLASSKGDMLRFAELMINRNVSRIELTKAVSAVTGGARA